MRRRRMTTMADDPSAERTEEEASLWAARIEGGSLTARDRAELSAWLAADPGHRRVLASYCELSALLDAQLSPADVPVGAVAVWGMSLVAALLIAFALP